MMRLVELEEARRTRGLRLVVMDGIPSPWSETAKGLFDVKDLDYLAVRLRPGDAEVRAWTGHHNAPVALFDDEPARTGWAEILHLAERLRPEPPLVPAAEEARLTMFGLAHEILGEDGLVWNARLLLIEAGLTTNGRLGFPVRAAHYLAGKYGYVRDAIPRAGERVCAILGALDGRLDQAGRRYLIGDSLSAPDIMLATAMTVFAPLPQESCAMRPEFRRAYESWPSPGSGHHHDEGTPSVSSVDSSRHSGTDTAPLFPPAGAVVRASITSNLLRHRELIYGRHLVLPVRL